MKKLDLYIIKKFLGTFFFAISLLIIVVIVFDISEKIDDFIEKEAPLKAILFSYYLNFIPFFVNLFSYLFTFIAVIFFTAKMASDSEIVAILGSGISFRRFLLPYLISAITIGSMSFFLANFLIPKTNKNMAVFEKMYIKGQRRNSGRNIHMQINPGTFIYMETFNTYDNSGRKFALKQFKNDKLVFKLVSDKVIWDSIAGTWKLRNYTIRTFDGFNETLVKGKVMDTLINLHPHEFAIRLDDMITMDYFELRSFIEKEKLKGSGNVKEYEVEKHKRIAFPFATFVLTLIGVSVSSRKARGGIGTHLGFGLAVTFSFILFMQISTVFATRGNLSPGLAVWIPNLLFSLLGLFLLKKAPK